jgi:uncharacterized protein (DUF2141 family)
MIVLIILLNLFLINPEINIHNIEDCTCNLYYSVYDSEKSFLDESKVMEVGSTKVRNKNTVVVYPKINKSGYYAILVFQDLNNNHKLDKNILGIPKEPIGFSNNFRPRFRGPKFENCKVYIDKENKVVDVKMFRM